MPLCRPDSRDTVGIFQACLLTKPPDTISLADCIKDELIHQKVSPLQANTPVTKVRE